MWIALFIFTSGSSCFCFPSIFFSGINDRLFSSIIKYGVFSSFTRWIVCTLPNRLHCPHSSSRSFTVKYCCHYLVHACEWNAFNYAQLWLICFSLDGVFLLNFIWFLLTIRKQNEKENDCFLLNQCYLFFTFWSICFCFSFFWSSSNHICCCCCWCCSIVIVIVIGHAAGPVSLH